MVLMVLVIVLLALLGAAMGSFVGALVWRVKTNKDFVKDRSICEHCEHKLAPLDLIPIVSWITLKGRCRYCGKKIGWLALVLELTLPVLFVASYVCWPLGFESVAAQISFGFWLLYVVLLAALFVYDLKWFLLPDKIVFVLIGLGLVDAMLRTSITGENYLTHVALGVLPIAGTYGLLYVVSGGKWVGLGDVKIGIFMGIVLGWQAALLTLVLANLIGFLVVVPGLVSKKLTRKSKVPFGPFLIAAFFIAGLWGQPLIDWYIFNVLLSVVA
jgi:prepilin signal peptidase PulO-like enzyme (type II secretory pathway)